MMVNVMVVIEVTVVWCLEAMAMATKASRTAQRRILSDNIGLGCSRKDKQRSRLLLRWNSEQVPVWMTNIMCVRYSQRSVRRYRRQDLDLHERQLFIIADAVAVCIVTQYNNI